MSQYEERLARLIQIHGLPTPERQFRFATPLREYRVDFAWPARRLLVEVDGGSFVGRGGKGSFVSRTTPVGYHQSIEDYRKRNLANLLGFTLLSFLPEQLEEAIAEIRLWLEGCDPTRSGFHYLHIEDFELVDHVEKLAEDDARRRKMRELKTKARKASKEWAHKVRR